MTQIRWPFILALPLLSAGGCMRGMSYRIPMPSSMTLGTIQDEPATTASARRGQLDKAGPQANHINPDDIEARFAVAGSTN